MTPFPCVPPGTPRAVRATGTGKSPADPGERRRLFVDVSPAASAARGEARVRRRAAFPAVVALDAPHLPARRRGRRPFARVRDEIVPEIVPAPSAARRRRTPPPRSQSPPAAPPAARPTRSRSNFRPSRKARPAGRRARPAPRRATRRRTASRGTRTAPPRPGSSACRAAARRPRAARRGRAAAAMSAARAARRRAASGRRAGTKRRHAYARAMRDRDRMNRGTHRDPRPLGSRRKPTRVRCPCRHPTRVSTRSRARLNRRYAPLRRRRRARAPAPELCPSRPSFSMSTFSKKRSLFLRLFSRTSHASDAVKCFDKRVKENKGRARRSAAVGAITMHPCDARWRIVAS